MRQKRRTRRHTSSPLRKNTRYSVILLSFMHHVKNQNRLLLIRYTVIGNTTARKRRRRIRPVLSTVSVLLLMTLIGWLITASVGCRVDRTALVRAFRLARHALITCRVMFAILFLLVTSAVAVRVLGTLRSTLVTHS